MFLSDRAAADTPRRRRCLVVAAILFAVGPQATAMAEPRWRIKDLGPNVFPNAINARGDIVGSWNDLQVRAFRYASGGSLTPLADSAIGSVAHGIATSGLIAGENRVPSPTLGDDPHAWVFGVGDIHPGPGRESTAEGVGADGTVVGSAEGASGARRFGFTWRNGTLTPLARLADGAEGPYSHRPTAVNALGVVVGEAEMFSRESRRPVMWHDGQIGLIPIPLGWSGGANAINDSGVIVGYAAPSGQPYAGYRYEGGVTTTPLPGLAPNAHVGPTGINAAGWIVGNSVRLDGATDHLDAILWRDGQAIDMEDLLSPSLPVWNLHHASAINDRGQIVGSGRPLTGNPNEPSHGFLLEPPSVPPDVTITAPADGGELPPDVKDGDAAAFLQARIRDDDDDAVSWCATVGDRTSPPPRAACASKLGPRETFVGTGLLGLKGFTDGANRVQVWAYDAAGHVGRAEITVRMQRPNLYIRGFEVAQAISPPLELPSVEPLSETNAFTRDPAVTLVAGKPTAVRVYVRESKLDKPFSWDVSLRVRAFRGTSELPGSPLNVRETVAAAPDEGATTLQADPRKSLDFAMPNAWLAGGIRLVLELNPEEQVRECDGCAAQGNLAAALGIEFQPTRRITIVPIKVVWTGKLEDGSTGTRIPSDASRSKPWRAAEPLLPLSAGEPNVRDWSGELHTSSDVCGEILAYGALAGVFLKHNPDTVWSAQLHPESGMSKACGLEAGGPTVVIPSHGAGETAAHELGHVFGLVHASCDHGECDAGQVGESWPYPHGGIGGFAYVLEVGTPDANRVYTLVGPGQPSGEHLHDFMSYGFPSWVSVLTWQRLVAKWRLPAASSGGRASAAAAGTAPRRAAPRRKLLTVAGLVPTSGAGGGRILALLEGGHAIQSQPVLRGARTITVRARDARGRIVGRARTEGGVAERSDEAPFVASLTLRRPAASLEVLQGGRRVARRERSRARPRVRLRGLRVGMRLRRGKRVRLRWTARDRDSRNLRFSVLRKIGAGPWRMLSIQQRARTLTLRPRTLPRARALRIRVVASDGFNTTSATSPRLRSR